MIGSNLDMNSKDSHQERATQLYIADVAQYKSHTGEEALLLALLFDGLEVYTACFGSEDDSEKTLYQEVNNWLYEQECDYLFSYRSSCERLGIDPMMLTLGLTNVATSDKTFWSGH